LPTGLGSAGKAIRVNKANLFGLLLVQDAAGAEVRRVADAGVELGPAARMEFVV
jgi:hypothetical protein